MAEYVRRLIAAYYEAKHNGEKKRAAHIYKLLWKVGVIL